jgi:protein SCO1
MKRRPPRWKHVMLGFVLLGTNVCDAEQPLEPGQSLSNHPSLAVIAPAPTFVLADVDGNPVGLTSYRGRVLLLAFVFTSCKTVCPLISRQMAQLQSGLKEDGSFGTQASMLSVTIDPETDTVDTLRQYAASLGADPIGWRFLREDRDTLTPILKGYDEWARRLPEGDVDHPARVYLIDPEGQIREIYSLSFFDHRQVRLDIRALLKGNRSDPIK